MDISQPQKSSPQTWLTQLSFSRKESCNQVAQLITAYNSPQEKSQFLASTFWAGLHPPQHAKNASMLQESSLSQLLVGAGDFTLSNESKPKSHAAVNSWEASCRAHSCCDGSSGMEDCTGLASVEPRVLAEFRWDNPKAATLEPTTCLAALQLPSVPLFAFSQV